MLKRFPCVQCNDNQKFSTWGSIIAIELLYSGITV